MYGFLSGGVILAFPKLNWSQICHGRNFNLPVETSIGISTSVVSLVETPSFYHDRYVNTESVKRKLELGWF